MLLYWACLSCGGIIRCPSKHFRVNPAYKFIIPRFWISAAVTVDVFRGASNHISCLDKRKRGLLLCYARIRCIFLEHETTVAVRMRTSFSVCSHGSFPPMFSQIPISIAKGRLGALTTSSTSQILILYKPADGDWRQNASSKLTWNDFVQRFPRASG